MPPLGMVGKVWKVIITSAAVGLFVTLMTAALTTYGIVSISAARWMLFFAWAVLVGGITTSDYLCDRKPKHVLVVGLLSAFIIGGSLVWLDDWAIKTKAVMDARTPAPYLPKTITTPPPPSIAFVRTPKQTSKLPVISNTVAGNQNVTGNTVTQGPGSIAQLGGQGNQATINNFSPPARIIAPDKRATLIANLSKKKARVHIIALISDKEAYDFAQELHNIFTSAEWDMDNAPILLGFPDKPFAGVQISFRGIPNFDNQGHVLIGSDTTAAHLADSLEAAGVKGIFLDIHTQTMEEGLMVLMVSSNPEK